MTRQRNPLRQLMGRTALILVVAATAVTLLAPLASASPESDAGDAINQAWTAAGGDTSPLGARDGDLYPVGDGFGQNYASGAIFFSAGTGAKVMYGAILDKYRALGGPADSDLGFPNIDEGPGKVSPDSRNSTFSAGDNPVIFWTPDTGAWVVRGPLNAAWDRLGGSAGVLGVPVADETYDGDVVTQKFTGGQVSYNTRTKEFATVPPELVGQLDGLTIPTDAASAISAAWRAAGGSAGPLGTRLAPQYPIGDAGAGQDFTGGKIFFTPDTGAHVVSGAIGDKYASLGGPTGDLGFPIAGEADGGVPGSRVSVFGAPGNPVIFWTSDHGAVAVTGAVKAAWDKLGGATGALGVPVADQTVDGDTVAQKFNGGEVAWDSKKNTFTTDPANLAEQLVGLQVPQQTGAPSAPAAPASDTGGNDKFRWHNWWLWWIVPLAVLLLASLAAWELMRRRRAGRADVAESEPDEDEDVDSGYDARYEDRRDRDEEGHWSTRDRDRDRDHDVDPAAGRIRFGEDDPAAAGYLSSRLGWLERGEGAAPTPENRWGQSIAGAELFAHRGAHEAANGFTEDPDEDPDAVDTAPTRVQAEDDDDSPSGRHAVVDSDNGGSEWTPPDDDPYLPEPESLFAPVYGAVPPPPDSGDIDREADVMEVDVVDDEDVLDDDDEGEDVLDDDDEGDEGDEGEGEDDQHDGDDRHDAPRAIHLPLADPNEAPEGYPIKGSVRSGRYHTPGSPTYDGTVAEIWFASEELAQANGFTNAD